MRVRPVESGDELEWHRLRRALWPDEVPQLPGEAANYYKKGTIAGLPSLVVVVDRDSAGALGGFVEVSLRPIARGCRTTPVGYLEGWYVDPDLRRQGWGRQLVQAAERWAAEQGCCEMASDREIANQVSDYAHRALGFESATREACFAKEVGGRAHPGSTTVKAAVGLLPVGLDSAAAVNFVTDPAAGGVALFAGTTRAETSSDGRALVALDYEGYEEMARQQLRDMAEQACQRWPVVRLALLHRLGRVPLGNASVLIAVSTPHRAEAFECCRWLIDKLKAELAVWKKEVWQGGWATWATANQEWRQD